MNNLEDNEASQKYGVVTIIYCVGTSQISGLDRDMMTNGREVAFAIPLRYCAVHYCFDDFRLRPVMSLAKLLVDTSTRLRFRSHFGK